MENNSVKKRLYMIARDSEEGVLLDDYIDAMMNVLGWNQLQTEQVVMLAQQKGAFPIKTGTASEIADIEFQLLKYGIKLEVETIDGD